jgi:probable DNA repair protein
MRGESITRQELFARLAEGHAARIAVVTPNRRLAQELAREFDAGRLAAGPSWWEAADILPLGAFTERLYEDALYSELGAELPILLSEAQERSLWQAAIRASRAGETLLAPARTASECRRAWRLAHAWRIAGALERFPGGDDARAFAEWAREYARRCAAEGSLDAARLPDVIAPLLGKPALRTPKLLVAYAFDIVTPQARDFFDACAAAGIEVRSCAPQPRRAQAMRRAFPGAREELEAAARWARARLESGARRIGVVLPGLEARRREVVRVFSRAMDQAFDAPGGAARPLPFNVSLGAPLADDPLVRAALAILELASGELAFEQVSRLVRSPFVAFAEREAATRARLDAELREHAPATLALGKLVALAADAPLLRKALEALFQAARQAPGGERSPHHWARHFSTLLDAAGFPGERSLDSAEFQTRAKLNEALAELGRLERVAPRISLAQARAHLASLCEETLFQPESPEAPVQVLGVLESAGLEFDCLWVSGLTDEAWPLRPGPNPFLPPALQKKAGIPEASPEATLALAKRITDGWLGAADEVIVSHPEREKDADLRVSSLISGVPPGTPETPMFADYRGLIFSARKLESVPDGKAPALATRTPKGGTRILSDQAACPFRAFARHRLGAEALEEPVEGLDARARGLLLHLLMKELWSELKGSEALAADAGPAIARAAAAAVREAGLQEPLAELERTRLARLASEWLEVERARRPFTVVAIEERRKLAVAGLELNGRIDRMDRLEGGAHALIDYKSGRPNPKEWLGPRPDDPQLPLYALSAQEEVAAVAFARLRAGEMRYLGFAREEGALPEVKRAENWRTLLAGWRKEVEALGAAFAAGDARVDPKSSLDTCRRCDLQSLCRVHERISALGGGAEADD